MRYKLSYFQNYYTRYLPSRKRLHEKIDQKVESEEGRVMIKEAIEPIIVERAILEDKVNNLLYRGKTPYFIRQNLMRKGFVSSEIEEVLGSSSIRDDFTVLRRSLEPRIERWIRQGKSRMEVRLKLSEHREFRDQIDVFIDEVYPEEVESQVLAKNIGSLLDRGHSREKIIHKLGQRGFSFDKIQKYLEK